MYTIWFKDGQGRQEGLTEDQMRKAAVRYDFDAKTVISEGETLMTEDYGETVVGGCFKTNQPESRGHKKRGHCPLNFISDFQMAEAKKLTLC